ncbi:MAG: hypothetical protein KGJ23_15335 [Euryarchaeota archaeon]|nr:hypothetical protein [Euryarchaeota archaeon]MDE1882096.1 hypothetical protein [Euryarchaeota archaeon]MDE2046411.1 hypothetical protein [Thermoplasmata archaeon]
MASVTLTFYLRWGGANDSSLSFELNESGWPWVSSSDQLGVELDSTAATGSEVAYSPGSTTLSEAQSGGGSVEANLALGPNAATSGGAPTSLSVSTQAGIFSSGASNNLAAILLTLGGPGGYAGFSYGPSLTFFPLPAKVAPQTLGILSIAAIGLVVVAAVILGVLGIRARRVPPEADLAPLNPSGRGKGTAHRPGPGSPFAPTS